MSWGLLCGTLVLPSTGLFVTCVLGWQDSCLVTLVPCGFAQPCAASGSYQAHIALEISRNLRVLLPVPVQVLWE